MKPFDIAPSALPGTPANETRFEEPRDIERLVIHFGGPAPKRVGLHYLAKKWPHVCFEQMDDVDLRNPAHFGWVQIDDWFNSTWRKAAVRCQRSGPRTVTLTFRPLADELADYPGRAEYNVDYRRTLGLRVDTSGDIRRIEVNTRSAPARTRLVVELNAGCRTVTRNIAVTGYNASIDGVRAVAGVRVTGKRVTLGRAQRSSFALAVSHMTQSFRYAGDDGHVTFELDNDIFTISLTALACQGPVWFADQGVFIRQADDPTTFADYQARSRAAKTVAQRVTELHEADLRGTFRGQPRTHSVPFPFGCRQSHEKFLLDPTGDLILCRYPGHLLDGRYKERHRSDGDARMTFDLDNWVVTSRTHDPFPMLGYCARLRSGDLELEQRAFACPILHPVTSRDPEPDEPLAALIRFRWTNTGVGTIPVELPIAYAADISAGSRCCRAPEGAPVSARAGWIMTEYKRGRRTERVIRASVQTSLKASRIDDRRIAFTGRLGPGESCELLLRVPHIAVLTPEEKRRLRSLDFDRAYRQMATWWRKQPAGSAIDTPEPRLNEVYRGHVPIASMADCGMADGSGLVNTSVGAAVYLNFTNEACMVLEDLDQRGLHDEVRRRLGVWIKFQGTVGLKGNYTDIRGMFFGAGGGEQGHSYSQNHGWVLWYLCEHYFITRDRKWFGGVADALVAGCDWVFRQRRHTLEELPHSRGWERGFLPAGALEDVDDYFYWLSTNCLTWRGVDTAARALADIDHPDAPRIQREADAYRRALRRGLETSRQYAPLIRLRDGRWVPHYPSRLYCRGRDMGWIRETLEGSVYLLLSGLYSPSSRQAQWILDDYQDTRYMNPPHGYDVGDLRVPFPDRFSEQADVGAYWFRQGGISFQPNLLAGLLPYLDRDEIEIYIWMFLNAWVSCYSEEVGSLFEHPIPILGHTNYAAAKTSDQANSMKWLRYMFVYAPGDTLYIGRAIPRAWLAGSKSFGIGDVSTRFGRVKVEYQPLDGSGRLAADVTWRLHSKPARTVLRFRHPEAKAIRAVRVNGKRHKAFDPRTGDIDITGYSGKLRIVAT